MDMTIWVATIVLISTEIRSECPTTWLFYEKENVCLGVFFRKYQTRCAARKICRTFDGDLVQFWHIDKEQFFRRTYTTNRNYWIGIKIQNGDYRYLNGTTLKANRRVNGWPTSVSPYEGPCLRLFGLGAVWTVSCNQLYSYICEIYLKPTENTSYPAPGKCAAVTRVPKPIPMETDEMAGCPSHWYFYHYEKICFAFYTIEASWDDARNQCQDSSGDLIQIWDTSKRVFIKDRRNEDIKSYWVGATVSDGDGYFENLNGTRLPPMLQPENKEAVNSQQCLAMDAETNEMVSANCADERVYICEIRLTQHETETKFNDNVCSLDFCICKKTRWKYFWQDKTYIKINKAATNFSISTFICESLGGNLLTVPNARTQAFIKNLDDWAPTSVFYWMGLSKGDHQWEWIDGKKLAENDYQNWSYRSSDGRQNCVGVKWEDDAKWTPMNCNHEHYHICEAPEPCKAYLMMFYNDMIPLNNSNVTIINDQDIIIKCSIRGYPHILFRLRVDCDEGWFVKGKGTHSVTMTVHVDVKMHKKYCACRLIYNDGNRERIEIGIDYKTRPRLVDQKENNQSIYLVDKFHLELEFDIYASPEPAVYNLTQDGLGVNPREYLVKKKAITGKAIHYRMDLQLTVRRNFERGTFVLTIDNGVKERLEFTFHLYANPEKVMVIYFSQIVMTVLLIGVLWMFLLAGMRWRRKDKPEKVENLHDEDIYSKVAKDRASRVRVSDWYFPNVRVGNSLELDPKYFMYKQMLSDSKKQTPRMSRMSVPNLIWPSPKPVIKSSGVDPKDSTSRSSNSSNGSNSSEAIQLIKNRWRLVARSTSV